MLSFDETDSVNQKCWRELQKPAVIAVRPAHKSTVTRIANDATMVAEEPDDIGQADAVSAKLDGVAIDIPSTAQFKIRAAARILHARLILWADDCPQNVPNYADNVLKLTNSTDSKLYICVRYLSVPVKDRAFGTEQLPAL